MEADWSFDNVKRMRQHYKDRIAELTAEIERLRAALVEIRNAVSVLETLPSEEEIKIMDDDLLEREMDYGRD